MANCDQMLGEIRRAAAALGTIALCNFWLCTGCCPNHGSVRSTSLQNTSSRVGLNGSQPAFEAVSDSQLQRASGLVRLEPYRPARIPVVFIHGLLSSPDTWSDMVADLRRRPDIVERYQFWAFGYRTGKSFLGSAAQLRSELSETLASLDPAGADPSLHRIVLVGHSMGGLIAKLQVTESGCSLWQTVANCPVEAIHASGEAQYRLYSELFFEPSPHIERVVFVAAPHRGSSLASRMVGRFGSFLMDEPDQGECWYRQLVRDNPYAFATFVQSRLPTNMDMLRPGNPVLQTIETLPVGCRVRMHSIIGTGLPIVSSGPADGVVPVSSAWLGDVESDLRVPTTHRWIHRDRDTADEIARILREHAAARL